MKHLFAVTLSLFFLICHSSGSDKIRNCQVIFMDIIKDSPKEFHLFDGTASHKIQRPSRNLSAMIKLPKGDLALSLTLDPVKKPNNLPKDVTTVEVLTKTNDFYLLVFRDPENKTLPLRIEMVDAGQELRKAGQTLWVNLTKHTITANLGTKSLTVPAEGRAIGEAPLAASGHYKADFFYQVNGEGETLPIMKKSWWFDTRSKNISFIINSGKRLPKTVTFKDQLAPK